MLARASCIRWRSGSSLSKRLPSVVFAARDIVAGQRMTATGFAKEYFNTMTAYDRQLTVIQKALDSDKDLPVCKACGTQYASSNGRHHAPPDACVVCEDPRQFVPPTGQEWTSIGAWLANEPSFDIDNDASVSDDRIYRINVHNRPAGIGGQTPLLLMTRHGVVIWDCCATCTPSLLNAVLAVAQKHGLPILAIALSHPHFYTTSLTWAKALSTRIYASKADAEWWRRNEDAEALEKHVVWYETETHELAPGLTLVRCGGHFDGSAVLLWDRGRREEGSSTTNPATTVCFPSDTFMTAANHQQVSFMWSYPNSLPLPPSSIVGIWHALKEHPFDDIIGSWPGQYIKGNAHAKLLSSAKRFVQLEGHDPSSFDW